MARAILESEGFTVVGEAEDGATAIARLRELRPDIVLLDVQLPDTDGFAVATELTSNGSSPDIVLTSSRDASDFGSLVDESGARGFVPKAEISAEAIAALHSMRQAARLWLVVVPRRLARRRHAVALGARQRRRDTTPSGPVLVVELVVGWSFIAAGLVARTRRPGEPNRPAADRRRLRLVPERARLREQLLLWTLGLRRSARSGSPSSSTPCWRTRAGSSRHAAASARRRSGTRSPRRANIADRALRARPGSCSTARRTRCSSRTTRRPPVAILLVVQVLGAAFLIWVGVAVILRWRGSTAAGRRLLGPVLLAGGLSLALFGVSLGLQTFSRARPISRTRWPRSRSSRCRSSSSGASSARGSRGPTSASCSSRPPSSPRRGRRRRTCATLRDPTLELVFWLAERGTYVDVDGQTYELPQDDPARAVTPIATATGR